MKEFRNLELCNYRDEHIWIIVRASLEGGQLEISGQDLGDAAEDFWGDDDYEYWYRLGREETGKLLFQTGGMEDPEKAVLEHFSGRDGCRNFREFCSAHGIAWEFFSYA